jgi:hypothetical protein
MKKSYYLECITLKSAKRNLGKSKRKILERWMYCFEDIRENEIDEIDLFNFFKNYIVNDKRHLEAFKVVTKISSAFNNATNPPILTNHLKTLFPQEKYYDQLELAGILGCDRRELNELLGEIGLDKQSLLKKGKKGLSLEDALTIRYLLNALSNETDRITAYKRITKQKQLKALTEDDLRLKNSKKLRDLNSKTGVFEE